MPEPFSVVLGTVALPRVGLEGVQLAEDLGEVAVVGLLGAGDVVTPEDGLDGSPVGRQPLPPSCRC